MAQRHTTGRDQNPTNIYFAELPEPAIWGRSEDVFQSFLVIFDRFRHVFPVQKSQTAKLKAYEPPK
jgi:hypothetical protein